MTPLDVLAYGFEPEDVEKVRCIKNRLRSGPQLSVNEMWDIAEKLCLFLESATELHSGDIL